MEKVAFITGASSGIGLETAKKLGINGFNIIALARRKDRLKELENLLSKYTNVYTICCDVRNFNQLKLEIEKIPENLQKIDVLINNAGLALDFKTIDEYDVEDWNIMIDTNIKGVLYITHLLLPYLKKGNLKQIINIGSIAAKETYLKGNVYCATKSAIDSLSKAMRIDLLKHEIKVTCVHPGLTETEFAYVRFKNNKEKAQKVYQNFTPLKPQDIAEIIFFIINLPKHVCINDILVMPTQQASAYYNIKNVE